MKYIEAEKKYFGNYIEGGIAKIGEYITRKSCNGIWGDDIEVQALSEIYDRPIEIYAYSSKPMRTFHEGQEEGNTVIPIRLSYHGKSHYNTIVPKEWTVSCALVTSEPGFIEKEALEWSEKNAIDQIEDDNQKHLNQIEEQKIPESEQKLIEQIDSTGSVGKQEVIQACQDPQKLRKMIQQSRSEFEKSFNVQMDEALKESLQQFEKEQIPEELK